MNTDSFFLLLIFLLIVCAAGARYLFSSGKQLVEKRVVQTKRNIQEVTGLILQLAQKLHANVSQVNQNAREKANPNTNCTYVLQGKKFGFSRDRWAVRICITANSNGSEVELDAIGETLPAGYTGTNYTGRLIMRTSRKRRDYIADQL